MHDTAALRPLLDRFATEIDQVFDRVRELPVTPTVGVDTRGYIPRTEPGAVDLYKNSMQWSRRFIGLKVLFVLAEHGQDGIAELLDGQARLGDSLRERYCVPA